MLNGRVVIDPESSQANDKDKAQSIHFSNFWSQKLNRQKPRDKKSWARFRNTSLKAQGREFGTNSVVTLDKSFHLTGFLYQHLQHIDEILFKLKFLAL